jgi:magnesium chelatase family protein
VSDALVHLPSARDPLLLARVTAGAVLGIDAYLVTVEADVSSGVPAFYMVGLPQGAVKEARDRVHAALANSGQYLPPRKYTLNLAPAEWTKERWEDRMGLR